MEFLPTSYGRFGLTDTDRARLAVMEGLDKPTGLEVGLVRALRMSATSADDLWRIANLLRRWGVDE